MRERTLLQIDLRTPEFKQAIQDIADREGLTLAGTFFIGLLNQYPELVTQYQKTMMKAVNRKPNKA